MVPAIVYIYVVQKTETKNNERERKKRNHAPPPKRTIQNNVRNSGSERRGLVLDIAPNA